MGSVTCLTIWTRYNKNSGIKEYSTTPRHLNRRVNIVTHTLISVNKFKTFTNISISCNKTVILHVVLYGCETWPLTLREEQTEGV
jgi:hypothetical protein